MLALAFAAIWASVAVAQSPAAEPLHYWHVWVDSTGTTHQTQCEFKNFSPGKGSETTSIDKLSDKPDHVVIVHLPKAKIGAWHENPVPQWIIPLSGRWFVETMDGHRVEMGPGDASLGEDQGSKPDAAGHFGHLSGALDNAPTILMLVQLDQKVTVNEACRDN